MSHPTDPGPGDDPTLTTGGEHEAPADDRKPSAWTGYVKPREGWKARSKRLLQLTWSIVAQNRRLLIFPGISAVAALVFGAIAFALVPGHGASQADSNSHAYVIPMILASGPITFVTICCGVATASMVSDLLDGNDPSPRRALALLRRRLGVILAWTLVLWTIGAILKLIQERLPLGARIVAWLLDIGFSVATLFVVPVLAVEGHGPRSTFSRSSELVRERFGTLMVGSTAIGAGSFVALMPFFVLFGVGMATTGTIGVVLLVAGFAYMLAVSAFTTSLDYVFRTVLYRDAVGLPTAGSGFTEGDFDLALSRG